MKSLRRWLTRLLLDLGTRLCDHQFPHKHNFCTHLGHETRGAHTRHYVCQRCGALKCEYTHDGTHITPAHKSTQVMYFWDIIWGDEHDCSRGYNRRTCYTDEEGDSYPQEFTRTTTSTFMAKRCPYIKQGK